MPTKREFLVVYDYGNGGLWGIMNAETAEAVAAIYPELVIVAKPPSWMDPDRLKRLHKEEWHDIDGAPWGILNAVLTDRSKNQNRLE